MFTLSKTPESGQEQYDENVNLNTELKLISSIVLSRLNEESVNSTC